MPKSMALRLSGAPLRMMLLCTMLITGLLSFILPKQLIASAAPFGASLFSILLLLILISLFASSAIAYMAPPTRLFESTTAAPMEKFAPAYTAARNPWHSHF